MNLQDVIDNFKEQLGELTYFGPKGVIGIDVGASAIKFAEVITQSDGQYKINRYHSVDLPEGTLIEDEIHKEDEFVQALQEGLKALKSSYRFACIGITGPHTLLKRMQVPGGDEQEVEDQVVWETEQYLPFPPDDGNISYSVIGENQGGGLDVLVGAAKRSVVYRMKELIERSNVKVKIVDLCAASTINVLDKVVQGEESEFKSWLVIDVGAQKTQVIVYKNSSISFFKEIALGGITITEEIQRQMGVNFEEAESLKIYGDGNGNIPEEIVTLINQVLDSFFTELRKSVEFWTASASDEMFTGCYLTGGSALIPGFPEAIGELFDLEVHILNPFDAMTFNQKNISEDDIDEIAYQGVGAIGLAMRSLES